MDKYAAQILSLITSPDLLFPVSILLLVVNADLTQFAYALVFLGVGAVAPLIYSIYRYLKQKGKDIDPDRDERQSIYLLSVFTFSLTSIVFGTSAFPDVFWGNLGMIMAIFFAVSYLVNKYFDKFSMHAAMFSFVLMLLADKVSISFALLFVLAPLIMWSRLRLDKHTWLQLFWGWAIGLAVGLLTWTI